MFSEHSNCTCGEEQPNFNDRECREFYWNRRRRSSGRDPENCIIEESSDHSSDDEKDDIILARDKRHHRMSSVSDTFRKEKSVSRSSSGIGTISRDSRAPRKISSDDTSSRCFSPSLKNETIDERSDQGEDTQESYKDEYDGESRKLSNRMKQLGESKFGSLKHLKKALSKKKLFKKKKLEDAEDFEPLHETQASPKTPVLGKHNSRKRVEDDFGSFTEEEETYSLSEYEDDRGPENYEENYQQFEKLKKRSQSHGNVSQNNNDVFKPPRRHKSGSETTRSGNYRRESMLRQYKGDFLSSSGESESEQEMMENGDLVRINGRKYSSQMREFNDYDENNEDTVSVRTDKPAMNTLKKTFTAMLSRIGSSRMMGGTGDTSSDNISVNSRYSSAVEGRALADRPSYHQPHQVRNRGMSRASSVTSVNIHNNGNIVSNHGKKTFMYFSSDVGKGFIISDDEEVTGVISVVNMSRKKSKRIRDKITGTISDTLRRNNNKRKKSKAASNIPTFLFVNKPYFSSDESLADPCYAVDPMPTTSSRGATQSPEISRYHGSQHQENGKRYRSEMMLNIPNTYETDDEAEDYSTMMRENRSKSRSRHSSQSYSYHNQQRFPRGDFSSYQTISSCRDYEPEHEMRKKDRQRRKKTAS